MRSLGTVFLLSVVVANAAAQENPKPGKSKITVGKDTTFVTGPLDKQGYVDYAAALHERLGKGVTPDNNANVLLWQVFGPHPEGATMPPQYFRWLGVPQPPEGGDYFIDLRRYLKKQGKFDPDKGADELDKQMEHAQQRPWKAKDHPRIADWLKANEKPLALAVRATKRSHYYNPLAPPRTDKGSAGLLGSLIPSVQQCRELAAALATRAMLRAGEGDAAGAWQDLQACHRLGRLVAHGATLIEFLVGVAIDTIASRTDVAFLAGTKPDAKQIAGYLKDLQRLPSFPPVADKIDLGDRFTYLENVALLERHGLRYLEAISGGKGGPPDPRLEKRMGMIDWDPALRTGNRWFDRLVAALREKDRAARGKALDRIEADLKALKKGLTEEGLTARLLDEKQTGKTLGKSIGDVLIFLLMPAVARVQQAADRVEQVHDNLLVAFALEQYRRERGGYPKTLDALASQYLKQVPRDLFSGKALIYRPAIPKTGGPATGYLLYSVGVNGKDEGGRSYDDQPPGDDLVVRMPPPALRRP